MQICNLSSDGSKNPLFAMKTAKNQFLRKSRFFVAISLAIWETVGRTKNIIKRKMQGAGKFIGSAERFARQQNFYKKIRPLSPTVDDLGQVKGFQSVALKTNKQPKFSSSANALKY